MKNVTLLAALVFSFISAMSNRDEPAEIMRRESFHEAQSAELSDTVVCEWVDLALPSGTMWASTPGNDCYQWDDAMRIFGVNIPSVWQWKELIDCCSWEDADNGWLAIGKNGKSIFIPAVRDVGLFWSSKKINKKKAYGVVFLRSEDISTIPKQGMLTPEDSNTIRPYWREKNKLRVWMVNK